MADEVDIGARVQKAKTALDLLKELYEDDTFGPRLTHEVISWSETVEYLEGKIKKVIGGDFICQVANGYEELGLDCTYTEGGGYRCEVKGEHMFHNFGDHTIQHAKMGNGISCQAVEDWLKRHKTWPKSNGPATP